MLCGELLQRTTSRTKSWLEWEPEGEGEFGSRVEGTARTPKFWDLIEVWSWAA
jgi:hypothetical protein